MKYKNAVFSGSFDPMHEGHIHILKKANKLFDKVYVVISINPNKQSTSLENRYQQVSNFLANHNLNNEVVLNYGLTVEKARELGCKYLIRGVRNNMDLEYELDMQHKNKLLDKEIETVILFADIEFQKISSSRLK